MKIEEAEKVLYCTEEQKEEWEQERTIESYVNFEGELFPAIPNKRIKITNQSTQFITFTIQDRIGDTDTDEWEDKGTFAISFKILKNIKELVSEFMMTRRMHNLFHLLPIQKRFEISPNQALIFTYLKKNTISFQIERKQKNGSWIRSRDWSWSTESFTLNTASLYTAASMKDELDGTNMYVIQRYKNQDRCKNCVKIENDEKLRKITLYERIKNDGKCRSCFSLLKQAVKGTLDMDKIKTGYYKTMDKYIDLFEDYIEDLGLSTKMRFDKIADNDQIEYYVYDELTKEEANQIANFANIDNDIDLVKIDGDTVYIHINKTC